MDPPARPAAKMVGDVFAELYYAYLQNSPEHLPKFYKDDSKISRSGLDGIMRASTLRDIDEKDLNMLSSGGFDSAEVTSVISQDSLSGGVLVVVDGYFTLNERPARNNFTQSFFLAPQETGYFVLTDMFKFLDISEANTSIPPANNDESLRVSEENDDTENGNNQESHAVHLKYLPLTATYTLIENAFKKFGPIKRGGIKIGGPVIDYKYGSVEFEEADAAKRAIKASPVRMAGGQVHVEKKRVAKKGSVGESGYRGQRRIHEQFYQNRYENEQVRGKGFNNFSHLQMSMEEQSKRGTGVYHFWHMQKSMEGQSKLEEEAGGKRVYDFWDWQKSKEEQQSKLQEEAGETKVDHSWDYEQIMEEKGKLQVEREEENQKN